LCAERKADPDFLRPLTVSYSMLAVVSAVLFRRGAWKTRKV